MSQHGQVILKQMIKMIDDYDARRANLRRLVDDLGSMYQSLEPTEQPPDQDWNDAFGTLDELMTDRSARDQEEMRAHIDESLTAIRKMLNRCRRTEVVKGGR
jgi:hypothetical protein